MKEFCKLYKTQKIFMTVYNPQAIEKKWQKYWAENNIFYTKNHSSKPKYYVLDMFPYPSGDGLHVGHPLGYIASDIMARYKKGCGYNVLHPMGFDAFGLPAEQYAIQTGQHPAITTEKNISRYIDQMNNIGLVYDWSRKICTSEPNYYKWTQWIFTKLFESWYDKDLNKAQPIKNLVKIFEKAGNKYVNAHANESIAEISAKDWENFSHDEKQNFLLNYRLAFLAESKVNWCPALGTVLANEEVKNGVSERGGFPVEQRSMMQWMLRITAYADRLLDDLEKLDWSDAVKAMQNHWIGRSHGAKITFSIENGKDTLEIFTTKPETIFGVSYLAIAIDHPGVKSFITQERKSGAEQFLKEEKNRASCCDARENEILIKENYTSQGIFTGSYAIHPFSGEKIPIWIADYVLSDYGTGAVMAVPAHDGRDFIFAKKYNLPIKPVISGDNTGDSAHTESTGEMMNSDFLDQLSVFTAREKVFSKIEDLKIGKKITTFRMRDAIFSRQRYWGEPFPVFYKNGLPYLLAEDNLPLLLPEVSSYKPTAEGKPPLANAQNWFTNNDLPLETNTMPGWAGSSWYFLRYMDPNNENNFVDSEAQKYWQNVDLYIGGAEHATGHLIYARFWTKFLFDLGLINIEEPFKKLINQGMIQGRSNFVYRIKDTNTFVSFDLKDKYDTTQLHVSIDLVKNDKLNLQAFKAWRPDFAAAEFILNKNGDYICGVEVEKMSKSKHNIVSPDEIVERYGADTLRLYTMFLGPLEQSKPWDTNGIDGVFRFLFKLWKLFHTESGEFCVSNSTPSLEAFRILHKTIKKITHSIETYSFNTAVSAFMICVNELGKLECNNKFILSDFLVLLSPFAPHIAEELWQKLDNESSIAFAMQPAIDEKYLVSSVFEYPVSINGKARTRITFELDDDVEKIKRSVLADEIVQKWIEGKKIEKVIVVKGKIINVVVEN